MFGYCLYRGIGILPYAPLLSGHLARPTGSNTDRSKALEGSFFERKLSESDAKIVKRVEEIAEKRSWTMAQVALAWSCSKVTSPIVGLNSVSIAYRVLRTYQNSLDM